MKRFNAVMNDGSYINVPADRMELRDCSIMAWNADQLMAVVEITAVISAHLSEKGNKEC